MLGRPEVDPHRLQVFHELKKRRIYVGELLYKESNDTYKFTYDEEYRNSKYAIPIGPELDLFKKTHNSKGKLFPSFAERIPVRSNPAYEDYCRAQGISIDETNPIILLGSIGHRGPSSFVFEKTFKTNFSIEDVRKIREHLKITQHDFAEAFGITEVTLKRIESGESKDIKTLHLLQIYFTFPEVAIWQLYQTGATLHRDVLLKLFTFFHEKIKKDKDK